MNDYISPFELCPELDESYLEDLSAKMLSIVEATLETNTLEYDDNYTFETSLFGRMRQLFIQLDKDANRPWIRLSSQSMDYVARICNLPVRVFKDDPYSPKKIKVFFQNVCEQSQLSLLEEDNIELASSLAWRLLIEAPAASKIEDLEDLEDDYHVVLVGFHPTTKSIVSMWRSTTITNIPTKLVNDDLPQTKEIERKPVVLKLVDSKKNDIEKNDE